MADFSVEFALVADILVIRTKGYLEKHSGQKLLDSCQGKISPTCNKVIFNFSESPVINSSGLSAILKLIEFILDRNGGGVAACGISALMKAAFRTTGVFQLIAEFPDESAAVGGLTKG